jgi:hypothetical protein
VEDMCYERRRAEAGTRGDAESVRERRPKPPPVRDSS